VKTSGIGALAERRRKLHAALGLLWRVTRHTVVEARPLGIAGIQFLIGKLASLGATLGLCGEAAQDSRPSTIEILEAIGMEAGEQVGDRTPRPHKIQLGQLLQRRGQRTAKLAAGHPERCGDEDDRASHGSRLPGLF